SSRGTCRGDTDSAGGHPQLTASVRSHTQKATRRGRTRRTAVLRRGGDVVRRRPPHRLCVGETRLAAHGTHPGWPPPLPRRQDPSPARRPPARPRRASGSATAQVKNPLKPAATRETGAGGEDAGPGNPKDTSDNSCAAVPVTPPGQPGASAAAAAAR